MNAAGVNAIRSSIGLVEDNLYRSLGIASEEDTDAKDEIPF